MFSLCIFINPQWISSWTHTVSPGSSSPSMTTSGHASDRLTTRHRRNCLLWLLLTWPPQLHLVPTPWVLTSVPTHPHGWLHIPLRYGSCDQWARTFAVKELKLSSLAILLQCSSPPPKAELILHTWSVLDRYARQDSDQLTYFGVTNRLGVLFSETSSCAPGEKPLSTKERDSSACQSTMPGPASAWHE